MIRRLFFAGLSSLALVFALAVPVASAETFQTNDDTASTIESVQEEQDEPPEKEEPDIIRKPGTGQHPDDAGDRGGVLQVVLFVAVAGGITVIVALALRESRRNSSRL